MKLSRPKKKVKNGVYDSAELDNKLIKKNVHKMKNKQSTTNHQFFMKGSSSKQEEI